jgi:hypothetical protein
VVGGLWQGKSGQAAVESETEAVLSSRLVLAARAGVGWQNHSQCSGLKLPFIGRVPTGKWCGLAMLPADPHLTSLSSQLPAVR